VSLDWGTARFGTGPRPPS